MESNKVWALIEAPNMYDQPPHAIKCLWKEKPSFEALLKMLGGSFENTESILICSEVFQNSATYSANFQESEWLLRTLDLGIDLEAFIAKLNETIKLLEGDNQWKN